MKDTKLEIDINPQLTQYETSSKLFENFNIEFINLFIH